MSPINKPIYYTVVLCLLSTLYSTTHSFTTSNIVNIQSRHRHNRPLQFNKKTINTIQHVLNTPPSSSSSTTCRTRLNMVDPMAAKTGAAALMGVISGGILGGALHAIAG